MKEMSTFIINKNSFVFLFFFFLIHYIDGNKNVLFINKIYIFVDNCRLLIFTCDLTYYYYGLRRLG